MVPDVHAFVDHVRTGGVDAVHVTLHERSADGWEWQGVLRALSVWANRCQRHPHLLRPATQTRHVHEARQQGQVAVMYGLQNACCIDTDLDRLQTLHNLGLRIVQLTYNNRNQVADGCRETNDQGLSSFGRDALVRMNDLGLVIDLSHCSPKTTVQSAKLSRAPVAATHVGAHALYPHPRNKTDDELKAIADTGGMVGVIGVPLFLRQEGPDGIDDMLDHLEHMAGIVGIDRIGVGHDNFVHPDESHFRTNDRIGFATGTSGLEDLMPAGALPSAERWASYHLARLEGFDGIAGWPNLTRGLVARGYSDDEITGVLGANWLRFLAPLLDDSAGGE